MRSCAPVSSFAAVVVATLASVNASAAQNIMSANSILPGCKAGLAGAATANWEAQRCLGIIEGVDVAYDFGAYCRPSEATIGQRMRIVVAYIEAHPERMHERFALLAVEALRRVWPCPTGQPSR